MGRSRCPDSLDRDRRFSNEVTDVLVDRVHQLMTDISGRLRGSVQRRLHERAFTSCAETVLSVVAGAFTQSPTAYLKFVVILNCRTY